MSLIQPHGGVLVDLESTNNEWRRVSERLPVLSLNAREESDLELIANGAFSPLTGFMCEADYVSVRDRGRLSNGLVWTIPITLSATAEECAGLEPGQPMALRSRDGRLVAILHLEEIFTHNKQREAEQVYLTTEDRHPGVRYINSQGEFLLGGGITLIDHPQSNDFASYRSTPKRLREKFAELGWRRIVAFQTRNPVHRAHEYIQKCALEVVDGLLIHPLVGETKADDIPAAVRLRAYEVIIEHYYPRTRTLLAVLPAAMRYAGPREAVFHAIIRKNYGCSHFIVGRDHAGVGSYYGSYDAQKIFGDFSREELGITPMFFDNTFYCRRCEAMASAKTCPHGTDDHVSLSGTRVREMLSQGEIPPVEFTRPEVAEVLIAGLRA
jgi:sulfate adenylyltransferase